MTDVKETTVYESLLDVKNDDVAPPTLDQYFDVPNEDSEIDDVEWKKHWVGMPEFVQEPNAPFMTIKLHFRSKEDYDEFAKLIAQNLSDKTKSIWYPKLDRDQNSLKRWVE